MLAEFRGDGNRLTATISRTLRRFDLFPNDAQRGRRRPASAARAPEPLRKDGRSLRLRSRTPHGLVTTDRRVALLARALFSGTLRLGALSSVALAALAAGPAPAAAAEPPIVAFDRFIAESDAVCRSGRAVDCVDLAWRFADADGDQGLSLEELQAIRTDVEVWAIWRQADLAAHERSGIAMGLWLVDAVGLDYLHAVYDADGDGLISRSELLADVRLDERPIGAVLLDPQAVDHASIGRRLGLPPSVLDRLPLDQGDQP